MDRDERDRALHRYRENRDHTRKLFDAITPDAYYNQPVALRQPVVFYEGHFSAFVVNTLLKKALGHDPINPHYEDLFERGIDPESVDEARAAGAEWPSRNKVLAYVEATDQAVLDAIRHSRLEDEQNPLLRNAEALYTCLEHEEMHHETLRYMYHRLPFEMKPGLLAPARPVTGGNPPEQESIAIPAGTATLGARRGEIRFGWDNEFEREQIEVPPFEIDRFSVTNRDFMRFLEAGGYRNRALWSDEGWQWVEENQVAHPLFWEQHDGGWYWRGMHELIPLPSSWPVWVSHAEASAYARWKERRLPTEAEYHRAAFGTPDGHEQAFPWGDEPPDHSRGNFDYQHSEPLPVGSFPAGRSAFGVDDLIGNGWEWTASEFRPLAGFREMASYPPYSSDFFDGKHFVIKGASPVTSRHLVRRSLRNWFRGTYPYMYAKFRLVR